MILMRKLVLSVAATAVLMLSGPSVASPAMNPSGLAAAIENGGADLLQPILHGCGAGWWRGPDGVGRCRPMRGRLVAPPPLVVVPRPNRCHRVYSSRWVRC